MCTQEISSGKKKRRPKEDIMPQILHTFYTHTQKQT